MDTRNKKVKSPLSVKLLKAVLLAACILGFILSFIQVIFDAYQSSDAIDDKAHEMLALIDEPATRAAATMDKKMGEEVLNGLLELKSVQVAAIRLDGKPQLAMIERELSKSRYRLLSDYIFEPIRIYRLPLYLNTQNHQEYIGELILAIDTAIHGKDFIQRSVIVLLSGIVRAIAMGLMLYLIYSVLLTKPLNRLITHLLKLDPEQPGQQKLPVPRGHRNNELGLWVKAANNLLEAIEHNFNLRQKAEAQIMRLSQYDYLTRLPNRKTIQKQLKELIEQGSVKSENAAILCLGLDDFKSLNAQLSFNAAELILVKLADRLRTHLNNTFLGRLGEDQFAIILKNIEQPYEAAELAQSMLKLLTKPFEINNEQHTISATVGITLFPDDSDDVDKLLQQSEFAMIMAKSRSKNRYQFYIATIDSEIRQRKKLEMDLHLALEHHELNLVYQPQVDYQSNALIGVEALLRWQHPEKGLISPETFIPMAENSMDIIPIGDWVLESACHKLHEWHSLGHTNLRMAVNLSAVQLQDKHIVNRISYLLHKYKLAPNKLELEVTETSILEDIELSKEQLRKIKHIGVILSLDDFGTGYSSLSYLQKFPFDKIKIDKSFVEGIPENKENKVIVDAIIQLGGSFGMDILAEGVETESQESYLMLSGCTEGQGYYYGKPMSEEDFIQYIQNPSPLPGKTATG